MSTSFRAFDGRFTAGYLQGYTQRQMLISHRGDSVYPRASRLNTAADTPGAAEEAALRAKRGCGEKGHAPIRANPPCIMFRDRVVPDAGERVAAHRRVRSIRRGADFINADEHYGRKLMKLVTYVSRPPTKVPARAGMPEDHAGVLHGDTILDLRVLGEWAGRHGVSLPKSGLPATTLALLQMGPDGMEIARAALDLAAKARTEDLTAEPGLAYALSEIDLRTPVPNHAVRRATSTPSSSTSRPRARRRGRSMIPEWYKFPVFYFSNTAALYGADEPIPFPGTAKRSISSWRWPPSSAAKAATSPPTTGPRYIAGYMVMNDWSARDRWRKEADAEHGTGQRQRLRLSLGPWLVTPDELDDRRIGAGKDERYDLAMTGAASTATSSPATTSRLSTTVSRR